MRIFLILVGVAVALFGVACGASGLAAYRSVDSDGFVTGDGRMLTTTAAFVIDTAEFRELEDDDRGPDTTLRVRAESNNGKELFLAIDQASNVESFVSQGSHTLIRELDFAPFEYNQVNQGGSRELPPAPVRVDFVFPTSATANGVVELEWKVQPGAWNVLIMNVDGSPAVDVEAEFGVKFPNLRGFAVAAMVIGSICLLLGVLLAVFQFRGRRKDRGESAEAAAAPG